MPQIFNFQNEEWPLFFLHKTFFLCSVRYWKVEFSNLAPRLIYFIVFCPFLYCNAIFLRPPGVFRNTILEPLVQCALCISFLMFVFRVRGCDKI
jgi:hypothetical protein